MKETIAAFFQSNSKNRTTYTVYCIHNLCPQIAHIMSTQLKFLAYFIINRVTDNRLISEDRPTLKQVEAQFNKKNRIKLGKNFTLISDDTSAYMNEISIEINK